jgi:hypothetical protein
MRIEDREIGVRHHPQGSTGVLLRHSGHREKQYEAGDDEETKESCSHRVPPVQIDYPSLFSAS